MSESLEWLSNFLEICCSYDLDLQESYEQLNKVGQILKDRYIDGYRHRYSQIAALLKTSPYTEYSSDQFDMLRQNMALIESKFDDLDFSEKQKESSIKLFDHLILEVDRINNIDRKIEQIQTQMQENQQEISQNLKFLTESNQDFSSLMEAVSRVVKDNRIANEQLRNIRTQYLENVESVKKTTLELNDVQKRIDGFNAQSVTFLSIFTAIVFSFTGGFTILGNALSNLSGINRNESIMLISIVLIMCCLLLDIIYFLFAFIGKLSNIKFSGNCDLKCETCGKKEKGQNTCKGWKRFKSRHFLIKIVNICTSLIVTLLLILNFFVITPSFPIQSSTASDTKLTQFPLPTEMGVREETPEAPTPNASNAETPNPNVEKEPVD